LAGCITSSWAACPSTCETRRAPWDCFLLLHYSLY
jgi:hypothetical protein